MARSRGITLTSEQRATLTKARGHRPQTEIAAAIGVTSQHLNQLERGKKRPSLELLAAWAKLVGLSARLVLEPKN